MSSFVRAPDRLRQDLASVAVGNGGALVAFQRGGVGAVLRAANQKFNELRTAEDFGAVGDGVTDDTAAIQDFYDDLKISGGIGVLTAGKNYGVKDRIYTTDGALPFAVFGYGATVSRISDFSASVIEVNATDGVSHHGVKIDCNHQTFPNGNHGLVYSNCNDSLAVDVVVKNHKNTGLLMYATVPGTKKNNVMRNCSAIGNSGATANNGLLLAELDYSGIENGYAENIQGAPGYGLQLKNQTRWCWITKGRVKSALFALGWGNDSALPGVSDSYCELLLAENCDSAIDAGLASRNTVRIGTFKGSEVGSRNVINLTSCDGNSVYVGTLEDAAANQVLARLRAGCDNNMIRCDVVRRAVGGATGAAATFDAGVTGNRVSLGLIYGATTPYTSTMATNNSGNTSNTFEYDQAPASQLVYIAADAITLAHGKIAAITVDTEAAAAADDLATISGGVEGQQIRIRTAASTRDVTVKHGTGNILLNGAADFTLDAAGDSLALFWNSSISRWTECGRGNNQ